MAKAATVLAKALDALDAFESGLTLVEQILDEKIDSKSKLSAEQVEILAYVEQLRKTHQPHIRRYESFGKEWTR